MMRLHRPVRRPSCGPPSKRSTMGQSVGSCPSFFLTGTLDSVTNPTTYTPPASYVAPFDPTSYSGMVKEAAVKHIFKTQGLPPPPISIAADGVLEIGDPPEGLGPIDWGRDLARSLTEETGR